VTCLHQRLKFNSWIPHLLLLLLAPPPALHLAALHGHLEVIRVLLAALQAHNLQLQQVR
jgi:hypothetical protein